MKIFLANHSTLNAVYMGTFLLFLLSFLCSNQKNLSPKRTKNQITHVSCMHPHKEPNFSLPCQKKPASLQTHKDIFKKSNYWLDMRIGKKKREKYCLYMDRYRTKMYEYKRINVLRRVVTWKLTYLIFSHVWTSMACRSKLFKRTSFCICGTSIVWYFNYLYHVITD